MIGSNDIEVFYVACEDCREAVTGYSLDEALETWAWDGGYVDDLTTFCTDHAPRCPECGLIADEFSGEESAEGHARGIELAIANNGYCEKHKA